MPTTTVSSLIAQEPEATALDPISPRGHGDMLEQGGPSTPVPQPKETDIPSKMAPLHVNIGDTKYV